MAYEISTNLSHQGAIALAMLWNLMNYGFATFMGDDMIGFDQRSVSLHSRVNGYQKNSATLCWSVP